MRTVAFVALLALTAPASVHAQRAEPLAADTNRDNKLTLLGRVKPPVPDGAELRYQEYQVGDFLRSFILSDEVDHDRVSATLNNGVLKVWLPKAKKAQARKIQVTRG